MTARISVVVPTYSRIDLLADLIESLAKQGDYVQEVIVVDNDSPSNISALVTKLFPDIRTLRLERNMFYCGAANRGIERCSSDLVAVINDDAAVMEDWAREVIDTFSRHPSAGSVASLVRRAANTAVVDSAGDHLGINGRATNMNWMDPAAAVTRGDRPVFSAAGSCAVYRRDALVEAGGFDEEFVAYLDDVDLGFRLQLLGFPAIFNDNCQAIHHGGSTYKARSRAIHLTERNMMLNIVKNMPLSLIKKHWANISRAQGVPAPIFGGSSFKSWLSGKASASSRFRGLCRQRREIQKLRRVSDEYVEQLLMKYTVSGCHL